MRLKRFARLKTLPWANHFIALSHAMVKEIMEATAISEKNISVVYLGIADSWHDEIDALEIHHDVCFTPKEPESALGYRGFCLQFPHKSVYVYDHYGTEEFLLSTWVGKESFDSAIYADVGEQLFYNLIKKS